MTKLAGLVLCLFATLVVAQEQKPSQQRLAALKYPDLARRVRIQGDVRVVIEGGEARLLSGNLMLTTLAADNARTLGVISESVDLVFHYQLVGADIQRIKRRAPRGDAFDRLILRLFHQPTFRLVDDTTCTESLDHIPPNRADLTRKPVEVWIYARGLCLKSED